MQWYPWLNAAYKQIVTQHQGGKGHHALLIQSLPGMGDDALVWGVSRWLMCTSPLGLKSCGQCHGCQLMQAHNHPDWYSLTAEKGKLSLGVDAIRQVTDKLYHFAQQGGAKVVHIPQAEQLTEAAANALLKTLEEPPSNCWFFLSSHQPSVLPATLRSRCMTLHLNVPPEAQSLQWLASRSAQDPNLALTALRLSGGAPGAALTLLDSEPQLVRRHELCQALSQALAGDCMTLLPLLQQDDAAVRIHWLMTLLLDGVKVHQQNSQWLTNCDQPQLIEQLTAALPLTALHHSLALWMQCRQQILDTPAINHELIITGALLDWEHQCLTPQVPL